jgi:hypothetical protein
VGNFLCCQVFYAVVYYLTMQSWYVINFCSFFIGVYIKNTNAASIL